MSVPVVLVHAGPSPHPADVASAVARLRAAGARVTVVARERLEIEDATTLGVDAGAVAAPRRAALPVRLLRHAVRVVLRRTPAARFARAALADRDVVRALREARVVVAGDSAAIETVWLAARRLPAVAAVNGVPAALRTVERL